MSSQTPSNVSVPFSKEAERSVLAGVLSYNKVWDDVADTLVDHDFYVPEHVVIFNAIHHLAQQNKPFDVLTVADYLTQINQLEKQAVKLFYMILQTA